MALVFDGAGVKKTMIPTRALVTRYAKSSQVNTRLEDIFCTINIVSLRVAEEVETRRWSTLSITQRLAYLRRAIELRGIVGGIPSLLESVDSRVLLYPVLEPFIIVPNMLESVGVAGTFVVPLIANSSRQLAKGEGGTGINLCCACDRLQGARCSTSL